MTPRTRLVRWAAEAGTAAVTAVLAAAGLAGATAAQAATPGGHPGAHYGARPGALAPPSANPYSPAAGHSYRHGVLPTVGQLRKMNRWAGGHVAAPSASQLNLSYGGGVHGVGVTTGHEKVYLVFWGSQWGTSSTNSHGDVTLADDPSGAAPYLQQLFKGIGTGKERWSGVMTQYCDGVPLNARSCPANSAHVAYPAGGALAGVWVDESGAAPDTATGKQLGSEAVKAASHFGNTTQAANRDTQYMIISPTGAHPDGFGTTGEFCAWHDDTADPNLPGGPVNSKLDVAFTNLPYVTDLGVSCGENFVNAGSQGIPDGFSIVGGHEYAETITDQLPAFGWTNTFSGGEEDADLCAWNPPGTAGGTNDLTLTTGTFAMQSTWANDNAGGGCAFTHRVITNNWVLNGGFEAGTFAHWTTAGPATAIVSSGSHGGKHAARLGKSAPTSGSSSVAQTFTARGTHLSFWYDAHCPDTVAQSWATATLTDNTAHQSVTVLAKTCTANAGWRQVARTVIAGHSYTLKLTSHDDNDVAQGDGNYTLFDDVVNK